MQGYTQEVVSVPLCLSMKAHSIPPQAALYVKGGCVVQDSRETQPKGDIHDADIGKYRST